MVICDGEEGDWTIVDLISYEREGDVVGVNESGESEKTSLEREGEVVGVNESEESGKTSLEFDDSVWTTINREKQKHVLSKEKQEMIMIWNLAKNHHILEKCLFTHWNVKVVDRSRI